jgi:hypothetical protein
MMSQSLIRRAIAAEVAYVGLWRPGMTWRERLARAWRCFQAARRCRRLERGDVWRPCGACGRARFLGRGAAGWELLDEVERLDLPCDCRGTS